MSHLLCATAVLRRDLYYHKSSQQPFGPGAMYYHYFIDEETEMWEGWVSCPRLHVFRHFELPGRG